MWLFAPFRLIGRTAQRFHSERCAQTSAALSFATLLGLVPMIVAGVALVSMFPESVGLGAALEKFLLTNLLPEKAGTIIAKYVGQFATRAERVTLMGVAVLGVTALMQMLTIEHAFNQIWRVKAKRPFLKRLAMHLLALLLGPLAFGASLAAISFITSVSFGLVDEPRWLSTFVIRSLLPFVFMTVLFGLLYWAVPNKPINRGHALVGGASAASGFAGLQKLFTLYIAGYSSNAVIYGAFSAIPVFLVWVYASWSVIILGALLVAEMPRAGHASKD